MKVDADDGRIYLPKETRERMGTEFELIERGDKIILIPVEDDPLEAMKDEVGEIDKSVKELKEGAMKEAMEEAGK